jgi:hypothetical protein
MFKINSGGEMADLAGRISMQGHGSECAKCLKLTVVYRKSAGKVMLALLYAQERAS